ncbi:uncharacterized protein TNCV_497001 [Trichonephila clavipes]|nr:uncharacterized protein TNCV_497001 [Trichonephila clavipes]
MNSVRDMHEGHSGARSPDNKCLCVKRVWPMRRRVNLTSVLRIGLHGKTQNCNESFNNVAWCIIPNDTIVELQTLCLGIYIALILFHSGFAGLLPHLQKLGMELEPEMKGHFWYLDNMRIVDSTKLSKPDEKLSRKKRKALQKCQNFMYEIQDGNKHKPGDF